MTKWYSAIYKACIIASIIAFIIGFFSQKQTSLGAYIAGYSVLTFGIMMILIILFNEVFKTTERGTTFQIFASLFITSGPFLLLFGIIAFILYLLITYYTKISEGIVSPSYNSFSNIIIMLLLLQVYLIYSNITTVQFETTGKISRVTTSFMYLLSILTYICTATLYIILKYYSTDGFSLLTKL